MPLVNAIQDIVKFCRDIDNVALMRKLLEAEKLAVEAQKEIDALKAWNREIVKFKSDAELRDNVYWLKGDNDPYCSTCFDKDGYVIHLVDAGTNRRCPACGTVNPKPGNAEPSKTH
jgi:hypothetical protein